MTKEGPLQRPPTATRRAFPATLAAGIATATWNPASGLGIPDLTALAKDFAQ